MSVSLDKQGAAGALASTISGGASPQDVEGLVTNEHSATGAWRVPLELWLQWNAMYEQVTASAFHGDRDQRQLEDFMDKMDQVRRRAVSLSVELLK